MNGCDLGIEFLFGNDSLFGQISVSDEIDVRELKLGLIARQLSLRLRDRCFEWTRINLNQGISSVDELSLTVLHFRDLAGDARSQRNGVNRRDRAKGLDVHADVTAARRGCADHHRRNAASTTILSFSRVEVEINSNCPGNESTCDRNQSPTMTRISSPRLRRIRTCAAAFNTCNRLHSRLVSVSVGAVHIFALPASRRVHCTVNTTGWPQFPASARAI